jgi:hypothetical protein
MTGVSSSARCPPSGWRPSQAYLHPPLPVFTAGHIAISVPEACSLNIHPCAWRDRAATGHRDTDTVQADLLKITGDFRGTPADFTADGQQLATDATAAQYDQSDAMTAEADAGNPNGWPGPDASTLSDDYQAAMGGFHAAGAVLAQPPTASEYATYLQQAQTSFGQFNAGLTGFGLQPSAASSIDSPNA